MKIGLIRHFKVKHPHKRFMTSVEFAEWVEGYDIAEVEENAVNLENIKWEKCYVSDLPRAIKTAETIFKDELIKTELLREVPISPVINTRLKIPFVLWFLLGRLAWLFSHKSQSENVKQTNKRVLSLMKILTNLKEKNVLIASHGFLIFVLQKELFKNGFMGRKIRKVRNGILYIYQKGKE